jgi:hypothetical protein
MEEKRFDPGRARKHAAGFSRRLFKKRLSDYIKAAFEKHERLRPEKTED